MGVFGGLFYLMDIDEGFATNLAAFRGLVAILSGDPIVMLLHPESDLTVVRGYCQNL